MSDDVQPVVTPELFSDVLARLDSLERARSDPDRPNLITVTGRISSPSGVTNRWDPQVPSTLVEVIARIATASASDVTFVVKRGSTTVGTVTIAAGDLTSTPTRINPGVVFLPMDHSLHFEVSNPGGSEWGTASLQARLECRQPLSGSLADRALPRAWCNEETHDLATSAGYEYSTVATLSNAPTFSVDAGITIYNSTGSPVTLNIGGRYSVGGSLVGTSGGTFYDTNTVIAAGATVTLHAQPCIVNAGSTIGFNISHTSGATLTITVSVRAVEVDGSACCIAEV